MPSGPERLVLETCDELAAHGTGFVLDADIAGHLKMGLRVVRDCLLGLEREEFVDLAPLESNLKASVTPKGRQELIKDGRYLGPERRGPIKIVPKGLRSFDEHDADFFLDLLPPPRRPDGLPEIIHFWKVKIGEIDSEKTFRVGVIFGPSGCGKSSLVKAGLLPRLLASFVMAVYVEATADDTESRLLMGLRKHVQDLSPDLDLRHTLMAVKERADVGTKKVLLVIDQFEQWLHAHRAEQGTELATALRECDGGRVQGLILVRDDFSMALLRFMNELGIKLHEGQNFAVVDLFDRTHARRVLAAFGRGYGVLSDDSEEMTREQEEFLDQAIIGIAQDGRVISVRLALFAEMVKGKPWTPETLKQIGGAEGVGVTFLEETFSARSAPPSHRIHQGAAQAVLKALLPESGSNIKGHMRSHRELLEASGYGSRPNEFDDLLGILDGELRLVTPTASEGSDSEGQPTAPPGEKFYQLTHDYLVPSLREWLTRKQKETRRGRAELRLAERAASWNAKPENRHLPSVWEWANIRLLTKKRDWTGPQRKMMRTAGRHHGIRGLTLAIILVLVGWVGYESYGSLEASALVESVRSAETGDMPRLIERLAGYRRWANPLLVRLARDSKADSKERLHSSLALLPGDPGQIEYLYHRLLKASPTELPVIRDALKGHRGKLIEGLWGLLEDPQAAAEQRFHAACALADYDAPATERRWDAASRFVTDRLLTSVIKNPSHYKPLIDFLRPVRHRLIAPLSSTFRDKERSESERSFATNILADYLGDRPGDLADLLMDADPQQFSVLLPKAKAQGQTILAFLESELGRTATPLWSDPPLNPSWIKPDTTLVTKVAAAQGLLADRFAFCQTMHLNDFEEVAEGLRASGYRPIRFRPYADGQSVRVAAVWTRDGRNWQRASGLSAEEIRAKDAGWRHGKLIPVDVAGYVATGPDGTKIDRYAALWAEPASPDDDARMYVAAIESDGKVVQESQMAGGFIPQTLLPMVGVDGETRYSGILSKSKEVWGIRWGQTEPLYERNSMGQSDKATFDVSVSPAAKPISTRERSTRELQEAEAALKSEPNNLHTRFARALANLRLGNEQQAIEDFTSLIQSAPQNPDYHKFRAIAHARLQERREAMDDLDAFQRRSESDSIKQAIAVIVSAHWGEEEPAIRGLEASLDKQPNDQLSHYSAAGAYSQASQAVASKDVAKGKVYADRAVALLRSAIRNGYSDYKDMQTNPALDPIRGHPGFQEILQAGRPDRSYAAVWRETSTFTSVESHGLDPAGHRRRCREWRSQGYRPVAVSVARTTADRPPVAASVWHRPVVPEEAKEALAQRQAHAAVALVRLGRAEEAWPLLRHSPDPRVRSYIVNWLKPLGADPKALMAALESLDRDKAPTPPEGPSRMEAILFHRETSMRRALILALGQYGTEDLPLGDREPRIKLLDLYETDPDAGIHGAAEWTLRRWGQQDRLKERDDKLTKVKDRGERCWYVNGQGQTFAVIDGPVEFDMGSPPTEPERRDEELLHKRVIPRRFAIATKEVTVAQFRKFQEASPDDSDASASDLRTYSPDPSGPMIVVTWYRAAAYCNWLSRNEGLPECYEPNDQGKFTEGMRIKADALELPSYRLPTEAEWEYACRAGAVTSRCYGRSTELLGKYAWYSQNSTLRAWPCGRLQPNDLGLFDMLGNVYEWCQGRGESYRQGDMLDEINIFESLKDIYPRLLRGGSFNDQPALVRSANRNWNAPSDRDANDGFRPARTYP